MAAGQLTARLRYLQETAHALALTSPVVSARLLSQYQDVAFHNDLRLPDSLKRDYCHGCGNIMIPGLSCQLQVENAQAAKERSNRKRQLAKTKAALNAATEVKLDGEVKGVSKAPATSSASPRLDLPTPAPVPSPTAKVMIYDCHRCGRKTRLPLPAPKRAQRPRNAPAKKINSFANLSPMPDVASSDSSYGVSSTAEASTSNPTSTANASSKKRAKARKQGGLQALLAKKKQEESASKFGGLDLMDLMKSA
ncbi:Rpr2-domain-containing protein [Xylona heveae TC161]|uniref:Rpr2-domain-containing protein n=1 Tax=Xylona heveae (strain CBS 132557 / TC161) TaxID=1328760 RepID=A0A165FYA2_XYLHT|nr:Rpr2-domain-containing protein [Xylona heveae TC161]KZF21527.1 Rpr2-domain-containing protein [Xylona heveae TC161]